jgi:pimeloyl-ACP methyl ester carboxylesterase
MSQISTPPPNPIGELNTPTMFLVPVRDRALPESYVKDVYNRLPSLKKKFVEVDGGHYWMLSHPNDAAKVIDEWFAETL